jgi:hypothetical protein
MFAVNRFFAKVQLFLQNTYYLQHFFSSQALRSTCGVGKSPTLGREMAKVRRKVPAVRVRAVGQKVGLSEMLKNYAGSVSELIKN